MLTSLHTPRIEAAPSPLRIERRTLLVLATVALLAAALVNGAVFPPAAEAAPDADLARLLRFMAILKGGFACAALAACYWRLARPAAAWRTAVYVLAPGFMAAGAIGLWQLQTPILATIGLHAGLFALLAAALTDRDFIAGSALRARARAGRTPQAGSERG